MTPRTIAAALASGLILSACGHSAPTTLHVLTPAQSRLAPVAYAGPPVRIDRVRLPPAVDRAELLEPTGPGRYAVKEFDRWASAPDRLARQALAEDLELRLPQGSVLAPGSRGPKASAAIAVDVLSFSADAQSSSLTATWTRACAEGGPEADRHARLEGVGGSSPEALSDLIGRLADVIAADLAAGPIACPADAPTADPARRSDRPAAKGV